MRFVPHELVRQGGVYTCWPADAELWDSNLEPAQAEFATFLSLLIEADSGEASLEGPRRDCPG
jgi:agmatine deiminase